MPQKTEYVILDLIESAARNAKAQPLNLGGIAGGGGGVGAPPGGFIGWLPQIRVAYDETEAATLDTPASGMSLLDNLNHIRYRLGQLEISSGILIVDDTITTVEDVAQITFSGAVIVTDLGGGHALVEITASGGGTPTNTPDRVAIFDTSGNLNTDNQLQWDNINKVLVIGESNPIGNQAGGAYHSAPSGVSAGFFHYAVGDSLTIAGYETFLRAFGDYDNLRPIEDQAVIGRLRGRAYEESGWGATSVELRYVAVGNHTDLTHGTKAELYTTPSGSVALTKVMTFEDNGNVNIESGKTYNVAGTPHSHTSSLVVEEYDGSPVISSVDRIIFSGATVYDLGDGDALVTISGGGGFTEEQIQDIVGQMVNGVAELGIVVTYDDVNGFLNFDARTAGDARYLKLDTSNDPLTGTLAIAPPNGSSSISTGTVGAAVFNLSQSHALAADVTEPMFSMLRLSEDDTDVLFSMPYFDMLDFDFNETYSGGTLRHRVIGGTGYQTLSEINPYASSNGTVVLFDSRQTITESGKLLSLKNNTVEKFAVYGDGNVNIPSGVTYDIGGIPHRHAYIEETGITDRWLHQNVTVPSGHSLVLVDYINTNGYDLTLEGDAAVAIINGDLDASSGWLEKTETWTRTGNHTFTVSGDMTTIYRKGTKIRYKDGGSYEYGVINSSSHSAGITTITLIANTNYAMAAATITDTYLSYIENPEGYPQEFDFTPSWVNLTLGTGTYTYAKWSCRGTEFICRVHLVFGTTTSIGGIVDLNAPATSATYASSSSRPPVGYATFLDAGVAAYLGSLVFAGSGIIRVQLIGTAGSFAGIAAITSTTPFTWGNTDELSLEARYFI